MSFAAVAHKDEQGPSIASKARNARTGRPAHARDASAVEPRGAGSVKYICTNVNTNVGTKFGTNMLVVEVGIERALFPVR